MQALIRDVLEAWRDAERRCSEAEPGSIGQRAARDLAERLRVLYHSAVDAEPSFDNAIRFRVSLEETQRRPAEEHAPG